MHLFLYTTPTLLSKLKSLAIYCLVLTAQLIYFANLIKKKIKSLVNSVYACMVNSFAVVQLDLSSRIITVPHVDNGDDNREYNDGDFYPASYSATHSLLNQSIITSD